MAGVVVPLLVLYIKAPIAAPKSANGSGTVKNLMKSGFEIPATATKVSTRYPSREGTFNVMSTTTRPLKNKPRIEPRTPPRGRPPDYVSKLSDQLGLIDVLKEAGSWPR